jgi:hypothetical protein
MATLRGNGYGKMKKKKKIVATLFRVKFCVIFISCESWVFFNLTS